MGLVFAATCIRRYPTIVRKQRRSFHAHAWRRQAFLAKTNRAGLLAWAPRRCAFARKLDIFGPGFVICSLQNAARTHVRYLAVPFEPPHAVLSPFRDLPLCKFLVEDRNGGRRRRKWKTFIIIRLSSARPARHRCWPRVSKVTGVSAAREQLPSRDADALEILRFQPRRKWYTPTRMLRPL